MPSHSHCPPFPLRCIQGDAKTERLKRVVASKLGVWRDVATLSEAALASQVQEDKVGAPLGEEADYHAVSVPGKANLSIARRPTLRA